MIEGSSWLLTGPDANEAVERLRLIDTMAPRTSPAECLNTLRRELLVTPESKWLRIGEVASALWDSRSCESSVNLAGKWLAVDLDDTLLMGSLTTAEEWGPLGDALPSLRRDALKTDWYASAKRMLRGKPERVPCRKRHPFLKHPPVEVAFRPGLLEGLLWLKRQGLGVVLVTASARKRVEYLMARFPALKELVSGALGRLVVAEDLAESALAAEENPEQVTDLASRKAHALRPRSIAMKTPWAVSRAAGIPAYDLLIDDSATTASVFYEAGLGDRLLWVEGGLPWSRYGEHILKTAVQILNGSVEWSTQSVPLVCPEHLMTLGDETPMPIKLEDPLYYPLLHYSDQF